MKSSIKDLYSKCNQIRRFLRIWSHSLKKSLMENFIFVQCHSLPCRLFKLILNREISNRDYQSNFLFRGNSLTDFFTNHIKLTSFLNRSTPYPKTSHIKNWYKNRKSWKKDHTTLHANLLDSCEESPYNQIFFCALGALGPRYGVCIN